MLPLMFRVQISPFFPHFSFWWGKYHSAAVHVSFVAGLDTRVFLKCFLSLLQSSNQQRQQRLSATSVTIRRKAHPPFLLSKALVIPVEPEPFVALPSPVPGCAENRPPAEGWFPEFLLDKGYTGWSHCVETVESETRQVCTMATQGRNTYHDVRLMVQGRLGIFIDGSPTSVLNVALKNAVDTFDSQAHPTLDDHLASTSAGGTKSPTVAVALPFDCNATACGNLCLDLFSSSN